ncbi:hypothetical protein FGO68_gene16578 [Halteria grandinella]|uniref:Uncharacterized protein n=1 Tax=Halteria grandinella TaxID=5974 RepID=A0A8J8T6Y4_HALGN|nr:hypothetical protein FGO68_gene16578 [Halteria grandinella]
MGMLYNLASKRSKILNQRIQIQPQEESYQSKEIIKNLDQQPLLITLNSNQMKLKILQEVSMMTQIRE